MFKVGLSSCGNPLNEELFRAYAEAGITEMEISPKAEDCDTLDIAPAVQYAKTYGVHLWSFHLPFHPFTRLNPASLDENVRKFTVDYFVKLIRKNAAFGIDKFVVHASGEPIRPEDRETSMQNAMRSLKEMAEQAAREGVTIAVEDLPRTCLGNCSDDMKRLLSADSRLRMCFDTNHLLGEDLTEFVKKTGDKIITTHVSDYDFINERHWLPGEGKIDWQSLIKTLNEVNYQGTWMYEIGFACPKTIFRDRDLNCQDFTRNAQELFAGKQPTVFSRPKPNLGMWE